MLKSIKKLIPTKTKKFLERAYSKLKHFGLSRYCPLCNSWVRGFKRFGVKNRLDARCPVCYSLERHRFVWQFFKKKTTLFDRSPKKILHFAPEPGLEYKFRRVTGLAYLSADLYDPNAMVKMDITNIEFPDESFDLVYCGHVLEHIEDEGKAISEIYRVLKKDGQAIIMVPITAEKTFEDPSVTDPAQREKLFGQHDHVRVYGPDFKDRLIAADFQVTDFYIEDLFDEKKMETVGLKYILSDSMPIYLCKRNN